MASISHVLLGRVSLQALLKIGFNIVIARMSILVPGFNIFIHLFNLPHHHCFVLWSVRHSLYTHHWFASTVSNFQLTRRRHEASIYFVKIYMQKSFWFKWVETFVALTLWIHLCFGSFAKASVSACIFPQLLLSQMIRPFNLRTNVDFCHGKFRRIIWLPQILVQRAPQHCSLPTMNDTN